MRGFPPLLPLLAQYLLSLKASRSANKSQGHAAGDAADVLDHQTGRNPLLSWAEQPSWASFELKTCLEGSDFLAAAQHRSPSPARLPALFPAKPKGGREGDSPSPAQPCSGGGGCLGNAACFSAHRKAGSHATVSQTLASVAGYELYPQQQGAARVLDHCRGMSPAGTGKELAKPAEVLLLTGQVCCVLPGCKTTQSVPVKGLFTVVRKQSRFRRHLE